MDQLVVMRIGNQFYFTNEAKFKVLVGELVLRDSSMRDQYCNECTLGFI